MTQQFIREAHLIVGPEGSAKGLDFSAFRFRFRITRADLQSPATCTARIYNVSDNTAAKVMAEFTRIVVSAGYKGASGVIFNGTIVQSAKGKESQVDTVLDIIGADADLAYNYAFSSGTFSAGYTDDQVKAKLTTDFVDAGATTGQQVSVGDTPYPRGRVIYGDTKYHARNLANTTGASWSFQNGAFFFNYDSTYTQDKAIVLTSKTGLVGLPRQTQGGIYATALLNPNLVIGAKVWINNKSVQRAQASSDYTALNQLPSVAQDGYYRVFSVEHTGDTRGNEYYSLLTLLANDEPTYFPPSLVTVVPSQ